MTPSVCLAMRDLRVRFGQTEAVGGLDLTLARGETIALVGESGSGKSLAMLALLGVLPPEAAAAGSILFEGREILGAPARELDRIRGRRISIVFQEPMSALDPLYTVGAQIGTVLRARGGLARDKVRGRVLELLELVGIGEPQRRLHAYPHELSGGQRQRVAIAMAIANTPDVLIADEPTTALDVTVAARILEILADLKARLGMAMIFISHDLGLVQRIADRVYVMQHGVIVESGPVRQVIAAPRQAYTKTLLAAAPRRRAALPSGATSVLLHARNISVSFPLRGALFTGAREFKAVDDVSLVLRRGHTLGLVGESGSGKSTLGRALLKLVPASGHVTFAGRELMGLDRATLRPLRRFLQIVFQDPYGSLSPRMRIGDIVSEGLRIHAPQMTASDRDVAAAAALVEVGLDPETRSRYPAEFSGGQRQRIAIARAMILKPSLVVLDEPTSALDRSVAADIIALLQRLQDAHDLSYIFITHDLAIMRAMADEIAVMKDGRIVEQGPAADILAHPRAAYTQSLFAAAEEMSVPGSSATG
ncbi:MAG: ABC transporter ATP-binding protein [Beijerinckiaceae bacterium]